MKINYVKFFQAIDLPLKNGSTNLKNYAKASEHDITLDGVLITLKPVGGSEADLIVSTLHNVQYMKVANDTKTKKGPSASSGQTKEQAKPQE